MGQYSVTSQIERLLAKEYHRMKIVIRTTFLIMLCLGVTIHQSPLTMEEADRSTMIDKDTPFVTLTRGKRSATGTQLGSLYNIPGIGSLLKLILPFPEESPTNPGSNLQCIETGLQCDWPGQCCSRTATCDYEDGVETCWCIDD